MTFVRASSAAKPMRSKFTPKDKENTDITRDETTDMENRLLSTAAKTSSEVERLRAMIEDL